MKTQNEHSKIEQSEKLDRLRVELGQWQSNLHFIKDEMVFIDHLLNSYAFQPNTRNLFERTQDYLHRLREAKQRRMNLAEKIGQHKNSLGGILECTDDHCDMFYYQKHSRLKAKFARYAQDFQDLKSEIFNYAGGILKKRKNSQ